MSFNETVATIKFTLFYKYSNMFSKITSLMVLCFLSIQNLAQAASAPQLPGPHDPLRSVPYLRLYADMVVGLPVATSPNSTNAVAIKNRTEILRSLVIHHHNSPPDNYCNCSCVDLLKIIAPTIAPVMSLTAVLCTTAYVYQYNIALRVRGLAVSAIVWEALSLPAMLGFNIGAYKNSWGCPR